MFNEFILLEYFTSQSTINFKEKKSIFKEAIKLSNELAINFSKSKKIKKIHIIRHKSLQNLNNKIIFTHSVCEKKNLYKVLDKFKYRTNLLLISPENEFKSLKLHQILSKKFTLLNSRSKDIRIFSSKLKTYKTLKKKNVEVIKIEKRLKKNVQYISKPEYGTGSKDIIVFRKNNEVKRKKTIIQKFYKGKKGSFAMLCCEKNFEIICCNEQLLELKNNRINQVGLIIGGLESHRKEIYELGKKICTHFPNLFGYIGVDILRVKNHWQIIEINPRFTSSYIGLESAYGRGMIEKINEFYIKKKLTEKNCKLNKKVKVFF